MIRHRRSGELVIDTIVRRRTDRPSRRRDRQSIAEWSFCHAVAPAAAAATLPPRGARVTPTHTIRAGNAVAGAPRADLALTRRFAPRRRRPRIASRASPITNASQITARRSESGTLERRGAGQPCPRLRVSRRGKSAPLRPTGGPSSPRVIRTTARHRVNNQLSRGVSGDSGGDDAGTATDPIYLLTRVAPLTRSRDQGRPPPHRGVRVWAHRGLANCHS